MSDTEEEEEKGAIPEAVPVVSLNEAPNDDDIDLMGGVGLQAPESIPPEEIFKAEEPIKTEKSITIKEEEPEEHPVFSGQKPIKYNKNGKPRKPMTNERLEKLAEARKKALATRQKNKVERITTKKELKIAKIIGDDNNNLFIPKESLIPKRTRKEKQLDIEEAVEQGVKKALEKSNNERLARKELKKKKKEEEEKENNIKEEKLKADKIVSSAVNKLNDIDGFYDKCFNFS